MLETGDIVDVRFQDKTPVRINWLQAVSVRVASAVERREVWAYRLPFLLGAMAATAARTWRRPASICWSRPC